MSYTNHFKNEIVDRYKTAPIARAAVVRMGHVQKSVGLKPSHMTTTQYRIAEMEECCDWGMTYTDAPEMILHHAINACTAVETITRCWSSPSLIKGMPKLHQQAQNEFERIRERIDPVLYGLEKELDPFKVARAAYVVFETKAQKAIDDVFDPANAASVPKTRLREHQIRGVYQVLQEYQQDLQSWTSELKMCIRSN